MKKILKYFCLLLILYTVSLTVVYSIPNKYLHDNQSSSFRILDNEGNYRSLSKADWEASRLDNFTDKLMIEKTSKKEANPLKAAMSIDNYPRYWHGYQVFLRPFLLFAGYGTIRQLYSFIVMLLLGINLYLLAKKRDLFITLSFFISFYFIRYYTLLLSMQFSNSFIIMLLFNIFILTRSKNDLNKSSFLCSFFIVGSITNFMDLLTAPIITLGVPLITLLYFKIKQDSLSEKNMLQYLKEIFLSAFSWGMGYGLTWISKWVLASFVLRKNILADAFNSAVIRTNGSERYPLDRMKMFKSNIGLILNNFNILLIITALLLTTIFLIYKRKLINRRLVINTLTLLIVGAFPYVWYLVMSNHSQIHYYFTYRAQIVSVFAGLSSLSCLLSSVIDNRIIQDETRIPTHSKKRRS